jgi:hypothetical protein
MSKHRDWQMVKQIIATPNDQTDRYQCSKCGKIISAFACFQWLLVSTQAFAGRDTPRRFAEVFTTVCRRVRLAV